MNAHVKLSREERVAIARAIFVGASFQEVSAEFGISTAAVMSAVESVRRVIARSAKAIPAVPANRNTIRMPSNRMPSKQKPQLTVWPLRSAVGQELGIVAARKDREPSMPFVSILHK
ncbi:hypothetical protein GCM10011385_00130 [Nitratireductor aestuarii]|uniref:Uncharacterized protein n=1 Tax=Nitratireductor aestuarii TaxID=1735103 RepID=A0A916RBN5_9HYPH|nr:hypothetical protein [Nitratireductor aestuarii]GGA50869.1 hypothetical protein GCM10011385_00130 [Nitratireductor aestuarii]